MIYPITISNISELFQNYQIQEALLDDYFVENLPNYCKMTYDYYDNSIELYLGPAANNILVEDKIIEKCKDCGFDQGWINYTNQTEEYFTFKDGKIYRGGIKPRPYPKWTEEESRVY